MTCHMAEGKGNKRLPLDGVSAKLKAPDDASGSRRPREMTAKLATKPVVPMMKIELKDPEVDALVAYVISF